VIAERVAQSHVDSVRLLHRSLREFDALGAETLVGLSAVAGGEADGESGRSLLFAISSRTCRAVVSSIAGGPGFSGRMSRPG
jgi:hypothetical protein